MNILDNFKGALQAAIQHEFDHQVDSKALLINFTKDEFEGDFTLVTFALTKVLKDRPDQIAQRIGQRLLSENKIKAFNVIKGFLNISLNNSIWTNYLDSIDFSQPLFESTGKKYLVEFSSPNTNKPLHLGHIRNILIGSSTARILQSRGHEVVRTQIINDRGIAICKSMLTWQKFNGQTPTESNTKGDHLIGQYYVLFETKFKEEYLAWQNTENAQSEYKNRKEEDQSEEAFFKSYKNKYFNTYSQLGKEAKDMLQAWEAKDTDTIALWEKMNNWVYDGFATTYEKLGVDFDKNYYESQTYLLGKSYIENNIKEGLFYRKDDQSVWIDLEQDDLGEKLVLRSDGTSVYMTQDIGTAQLRYEDHHFDQMIYVVADEQDYHFKVLFKILAKLGMDYADGLHHLSYGMVDLPTGKMKSREGTIVDADDLISEVIAEARSNAEERGVLESVSEEDRAEIYRKVGLGALKFHIVKVQARKRMTFDPKESVDLQGHTGPYIQNAYVRIKSICRKAENMESLDYSGYDDLEDIELKILRQLSNYKDTIQHAASQLDPSHIASYAYSLAKLYHRFYHDLRILNAEKKEEINFRLSLSLSVANTIEHAMNLIGIEMPSQM